MKLSNDTKLILANFASINKQLYVKAGEPLTTMSEGRNLVGYVELPDPFESTFGIYDLSDFLNVHGLMQDPELEFTESKLKLTEGKVKIDYHFADESILTYPKKSVTMPAPDVVFNITNEELAQIRKASATLQAPTAAIKKVDDDLVLNIYNPKNPGTNTFTIILDSTTTPDEADFSLEFTIANLKLLPGDYQVEISKKLISKWTKTNGSIPTHYFIALDTTSKV